MKLRGGAVGRASDKYLVWLIERQLSLPRATRLSRQLAKDCRLLHEAALSGTLNPEQERQYRDEQRHVVAMAAVVLMLVIVGVAAGADALGLKAINTPLVVCFAVLAGAHVVLLVWLALPASRSAV